MNLSVAIDHCKEWFNNDGVGELDGIAFNMVLNAARKQLPLYPEHYMTKVAKGTETIKQKEENGKWTEFDVNTKEETRYYTCPSCRVSLSSAEELCCCPKCGQIFQQGYSKLAESN